MADLTPIWYSAAGSLGSADEGQTISIALQTAERMVVVGVEQQFSVPVTPEQLTRVRSLKIGGVDTPFFLNDFDFTVYWTAALPSPREIVVEFRPAVTFWLLSGTLPPGLRLDGETGVISGLVTNILEETSCRVTVRMGNGTHMRDRTFSFVCRPRKFASVFHPPSLSPRIVDPRTAIECTYLGEFKKGTTFAYTLDVTTPDSLLPPLRVRPVAGITNVPGYFASLPANVGLVDGTIQGAISPLASAGRYLFEVHIDNAVAPSFATFALDVVGSVTGKLEVLPELVWITPAGPIGVVQETERSYLTVKAAAIGTKDPVIYGLAPASPPLPFGLDVHPETGAILGSFPHVESDALITITVRARSGTIFLDRSFTFLITNRFSSEFVYRVFARLRVADKRPLMAPYGVIPSELLYRAEDTSFGLTRTPEAYLLDGLDGTGDLEAALRGEPLPAPQGILAKDYHQAFRLIMGTHRFAVARDAFGNVVYEVLFRELYDPMAKAGGFVANSDIVVEEKVVYPQANQSRIFPNSIRNMRSDLVNNLGLAVTDATARRQLGVDGPELLPLWMRSEQTKGDPSSIIGFHLGLVIAYLKPGTSAEVSRIIRSAPQSFLQAGRVYYFDKYAISGVRTEVGTSFDDDLFSLDGNATTFDATIIHSEIFEIFKSLN